MGTEGRGAGRGAVLHYLQASDELCKRQLHKRDQELPEGAQRTTDDEFDEIARDFVPPDPAEGFDVRCYDADELVVLQELR